MAPKRNYLIHPQYISLGLLMAGISALFLSFSAAYIYSRIQHDSAPIVLPTLFYYNTALIILCSIILIQAKKHYQNDDTHAYKISMWSALLLSVLFLIMQIFAWKQLTSINISVDHSTLASFMYLISGVHFLHLLAGIPFLVYFLYEAHKRMKTPISVLIYFTDPDKKRHLNLLNIYWHFLDGLWIYLMLFFLLNYLL